jgi:hypothetical protein
MSCLFWFVFTLFLRIVLGDNKKNKSRTLANNTISIKYALLLKNKISKNDRSKINFLDPVFALNFDDSNASE